MFVHHISVFHRPGAKDDQFAQKKLSSLTHQVIVHVLDLFVNRCQHQHSYSTSFQVWFVIFAMFVKEAWRK